MVIDSFKKPIEINDHVCRIGASAGISVYPDDSSDSETMLQHADMAMYQAKEKGRNCWRQYMVED
jgi:diguanylate cyclase (GGDEF)-like protein